MATLLEVQNLKKSFPIYGRLFGKKVGEIQAVQDVSFQVEEGKTLGIVGESGCGKSTAGRTILRLYEPTAGDVIFQGKSILSFNSKQMRQARRNMQMVFQDPFSSLNPRQRIGDILEEPLKIHRLGNRQERKEQVDELLHVVGLSPHARTRYPHEFSGGQRQRIGIARALSTKPKLIIADEPVSALDVSIQSQVLNLMEDLQSTFQLTYLFIAHDLSVVKHISDQVAVMYLGRVVEFADQHELFDHPSHPYTKALLSAVPVPNPAVKKERIILKGDVPNPKDPPTGCAFHPRCPYVMDRCKEESPPLKDYGGKHLVACHLLES